VEQVELQRSSDATLCALLCKRLRRQQEVLKHELVLGLSLFQNQLFNQELCGNDLLGAF